MRKLICSDFASSVLLKVDDSVGVNDIDVSLYIPRDVEETGITVASLERFSTYASDRDGEYAAFFRAPERPGNRPGQMQMRSYSELEMGTFG